MVEYFVCNGQGPLMTGENAVLILARLDTDPVVFPGIVCGPYRTRATARKHARVLSDQRGLPAYDCTTYNPTPL